MNRVKNVEINKKKLLILLVVIFLIILLIVFINKIIENKRNNIDVSNAIHGVIINENTVFYKKPKESKWKDIREFEIGENVYIVDEIVDKKDKIWYKVKAKDKVGYVLKENVSYYEFSNEDGKVLMSDVSKFNIIFKHFKNSGDYEAFILKNKINYVYIRAGGRGYGEEGNFYTDPKFQVFIDACEYLGVPYGFYYVDEAITNEEVNEEVEFIDKFIKDNATELCVLPLVIDIEKHDGIVGRTDEIWEDRAELATELVSKFKEKNIETIIYTNANIANEFLYTVDTKFWLAYYNLENKIPDYWFTESGHEATANLELMSKVVGWQFTENGAGEEINYPVDVSLVENNFFRNFVK